MNVLFLSSEVAPFSKTGGLADVAFALPRALARLGHDVRVVTPRYGGVDPRGMQPATAPLTLHFPFGDLTGLLLEHPPVGSCRIRFLEQAELFGNRPGVYGGVHGEYGDNALRFAYLAVAALSFAQLEGFVPDVVHLNDWQTALAAVALKRGYFSTELADARTVLTLHNAAYQGKFEKHAMSELGLPWDLFTSELLEDHDRVSFLKAGITFADALTAVSPTFARELQTPEGGHGLDGLLRREKHKLTGILNGVDTDTWDPAIDPLLPARFSADDPSGKDECTRALRDVAGLRQSDGPLFGVLGRMTDQKGVELIQAVVPGLVDRGAQVAVLGSGDRHFEDGYRALAARYPGRVSVRIGFDEALAHLVEAGSDFFLMPSRFEPCGLNQMYSLLYGAVPIVRGVGGLLDTVVDLGADDGTGVVFHEFSADALWGACGRALALWQDPAWLADVRERGMSQDFGWEKAARAYEAVYASP
ncbi:MAG: glycogen synthase GlgA [Myxococcaceae bacterium]|nr:glycogen synthase GlgA [Myxococcaceae bacterium]